MVGGHSKGGNLSIYSAMNSNLNINKKIVGIYNYDGPGFLENTIDSVKYKAIKERIKTIVPESSVVGRLLNYNDGYITIESKERSFMQHDMYSWTVNVDDFVYLADVDAESKQIDAVVTDWLEKLSLEEREKMINIIYSIIEETNFTKLSDFEISWFDSVKKIFKSYTKVSKVNRKMLDTMLNHLFDSFIENTFKKGKKKK